MNQFTGQLGGYVICGFKTGLFYSGRREDREPLSLCFGKQWKDLRSADVKSLLDYELVRRKQQEGRLALVLPAAQWAAG